MARNPLDAYFTPLALAQAIVERVATRVPVPKLIVEPTAGEGAFVKALRNRYGNDPQIVAIDLDERCRQPCQDAGATAFVQRDFLTVPDAALAQAQLFIGNPPFNAAEEIIGKIHAAAPDASIFFLLSVGFVAGPRWKPDRLFRKVRLRYFAPIFPRPSFTPDGKTDRMEYALFGFGDRLDTVLDEAIAWEKS